MALTTDSAAPRDAEPSLTIHRRSPSDKVVALAGNPNVGKSTLFNSLTGMHQHTGNWPGKTVANAQGNCQSDRHGYVLVDIPGTYSLMAHSTEEEIARNFICFGGPNAIVVVCDATCLMRNLQLVLQVLEITQNVVVCVNLMDEAARKGIRVDLKALSERLGVPVVGTVARKRKSLSALLSALDGVVAAKRDLAAPVVSYPDDVMRAVALLEPVLQARLQGRLCSRWVALRLLDRDASLLAEIDAFLDMQLSSDEALSAAMRQATALLDAQNLDPDRLQDAIVSSLVRTAESVCDGAVTFADPSYDAADRRIDRVLTGKRFGYPVMILLLAFIFWVTITGANYPSGLLADGLFRLQGRLSTLFFALGAPDWLHGALVLGVYRTLAWVVSVMLPPMAIFFPLFTLLEDAGYLPRVAFNLDKPFQRCRACGKQALTMCMGFGCNAAGVIGCRIIDSPRERLLAILTNNFVPCNGRFAPPRKGKEV